MQHKTTHDTGKDDEANRRFWQVHIAHSTISGHSIQSKPATDSSDLGQAVGA